MANPKTVRRNKIYRAILDFARDHKLLIHPGVGYAYYVESFLKSNACVCDPHRLECPCKEAPEEVARDGWCKCRLFWRDFDTFKESHVPDLAEV